MRPVSSVGQIAFGTRQQLIEASFGINLDRSQWNTFATQPRLGQGNQKTLHRRAAGSEVGQSGVDHVPTGETEVNKPRGAESRSNPTCRRRLAGDALSCLGTDSGRSYSTAFSAIPAELFADLGWKLHGA